MWQRIAVEARSTSVDRGSMVQTYRLDAVRMTQRLATAPMEGEVSSTSVIELPVNASLQRFRLEESPIMADGLAARYPEIKTYKVQGINNPYASGRLSMTPRGFHGMITSPSGTYYIDPQDNQDYVSYKRQRQAAGQSFSCGVAGHTHSTPVGRLAARTSLRVPGSLQVYRLAVAATAEYVDAVSSDEPSVSDAQAEIVIAINRVNQIYERDLGIRLELVNNNQQLSFTDAGNDPYSNFNLNSMLDQNQSTIDSRIGRNRYDIGHVFSTGQGGIAYVGSACNDNFKAGGVTGLSDPTGNGFYIDYVAHEIGHQLGAEHSFNGTTLSCGTGRFDIPGETPSTFEPGSGSTIMSYSGLCGAENIQVHSDAMFHAGSIAQVDAYTRNGQGAECPEIYTITNNPSLPTADAGADYVIPISTPFALSGSGSDADGNTLSYTWDQMDSGTETDAFSHGSDLVDNALMRSRLPRAQPRRDFPQLETQLDGIFDKAEVLPTTGRELNFRFSVRDGKSGIAWDDMTITTEPTAGPFAVTSHTSIQSLVGGGLETVTWSVAGTNSAPVSCSEVNIDLLMLDAGSTSFCVEPLTPIAPVTNDGSATVTLPDLAIPTARFRVSCADNIFYALSNADLDVTGSSAAVTSCQPVEPELEEHEQATITARRSSGGGGGLFDLYSLLLLMLLGLVRRPGQ